MKEIFKGFHSVSSEDLEKIWNDDKTIFIYDWNVLLNLYGYAKQTRDDFFKILKKLDDRVWIPYHVGLEYQRRRLSVIRDEKIIFNEIEQSLSSTKNKIKKDFEKLSLKQRFPDLSKDSDDLLEKIHKSIEIFKKSLAKWDKKQPCVRSHDSIRDEINDCFEGKVGNEPDDQKWLDQLFKEGKKRYDNKIPPGFCDKNKASREENSHFSYNGLIYERQYGDLIIWQQILDKVKDQEIGSTIFITDDTKEDWWYQLSSRGKKRIGPLAELQAEIYNVSNIQNFHMYSTSDFLKDGESYLKVGVSNRSIKDVDSILQANINVRAIRNSAMRVAAMERARREFHNRTATQARLIREFEGDTDAQERIMREVEEREAAQERLIRGFEDDRDAQERVMREVEEREAAQERLIREFEGGTDT